MAVNHRVLRPSLVVAALLVGACGACRQTPTGPAAPSTPPVSKNPPVEAAPKPAISEPKKLSTTGRVSVVGRQYGPRFKVELALTEDERARGLMFRRKMADDAGMLFFMPGDHDWAFYMRNTYLPLDMIFIDSDWRVVGVLGNVTPLTETLRKSGKPCRYVLELNAHQAAKHGIVSGVVLRLIRDSKAPQPKTGGAP